MDLIWMLTGAFNVAMLGYFLVLNFIYLGMTLSTFGRMRRLATRMKHLNTGEMINDSDLPPITLLAPAYNEEMTIVQSVRALLTLQYPHAEIIVVNDGSADGTLDALKRAFLLSRSSRRPMAKIPASAVRGVWKSRLYPNLAVIDKVNGGKADALNVGLNYCRTPLFCCMDADTILIPDALVRVVIPFLEDKSTVAAGGTIRIANGCDIHDGHIRKVAMPEGKLAGLQILEYVRAFLVGRLGWVGARALLIISGAFGIFRRDAVVEVGGYWTDTVGEDMELVVRMHRHFREKGQPCRVAFVPEPVAWTECPEELGILGRQRGRWQRGLMETLWRHRRLAFNPRHGKIGMLAVPYFLIFEMAGPVLELLGYISVLFCLAWGKVSPGFALIYSFLAIGLGLAISFSSIVLSEMSFARYRSWRDFYRLLGMAILENFGFRQMVAWFRLKGTVDGLRGKKEWGKMTRKGFSGSGGK